MTLSAKHFNAIAALLRDEARDPEHREGCYALAVRLADYLKQSNRSFDRGRFLLACGIDPRMGASQAVPSSREFSALLDHCETVLELPVDGPRVLYAAECDDLRRLLRMVRDGSHD